jgi:hypothetical protein
VNKSQKIQKYRIFPATNNRKLWFWVYIFNNKLEMHAYSNSQIKSNKSFIAITLTYKKQKSGNIGKILLCRNDLSSFNSVIHEAVHAAMWFHKLDKPRSKNVNEEYFARVVARISTQIIKQW